MKPPYRVPLMAELSKIRRNGFKVASTFSGCGGSSLGYKLAGFDVAWANEFVPEAAATYAANHPKTVLDQRDIRQIQPEEILKAMNMRSGDLDLFDGSPPCASFSTAGKREAGWGKVKKYSDVAQRTDDLFFEYVRLLRGLNPKVFVAENVSGLVKGTAKGYFLEILAALKASGYKVECRVLDAQWLGVPQARQRTIFVGVRQDLDLAPAHPSPFPFRYSIADACPWIRRVSGRTGPKFSRVASETSKPMNAILVSDPAQTRYEVEADADMTRHATGREWDRVPVGGQSEKYFQLVKPRPDEPCPTVTASGGNAGLASVCHPFEKRKFSIAELRRLCSFPDDFVLTGCYEQQWERLGRAVPPLMMKAIAETVEREILSKLKFIKK